MVFNLALTHIETSKTAKECLEHASISVLTRLHILYWFALCHDMDIVNLNGINLNRGYNVHWAHKLGQDVKLVG